MSMSVSVFLMCLQVHRLVMHMYPLYGITMEMYENVRVVEYLYYHNDQNFQWRSTLEFYEKHKGFNMKWSH